MSVRINLKKYYCDAKHRSQRLKIAGVIISAVVLLYFTNSRPAVDAFRVAVEGCEGFSIPLGLSSISTFPAPIYQMLLELDHVFVLSLDFCSLQLPKAFSGRATCVLGGKLDSCAPNLFIRGPYVHAMKVSFMHAAVLSVARTAQYKHVAIIEDDVVVRHRIFSENITSDFHRLLHSPSWSIIRFGFRPYFLEESSTNRCPSRCRCKLQTQVAEEFCQLTSSGCDLRSSDFYVIHERLYMPLQSKILDLKQPNSKRIVDTSPLRQFTNQWLILPQVSIQVTLDIPLDYQIGLGALFIKKCVYPRPLTRITSQQFLKNWSSNVYDCTRHQQ